MKTLTVELEPEDIPWLLELAEKRRDDAIVRRDQAAGEVSEWDRKIKRLRAAAESQVVEPATEPPNELARSSALPLTPGGRVQRGESERVILDFLRNRNGTGATITEITKATGTKYGTAHRLIKVFETMKLVRQTPQDQRWHWIRPAEDNLLGLRDERREPELP